MPGTADSGISLSRSRGKRRRDLRSQERPQPGGQVTVCWAQAAYWSGTFAGLVLAYGVVLSCSLEITKELVCIYCQESMRVPKSASTHVYRTCYIECTRAGPPGHGQTKRDAEWSTGHWTSCQVRVLNINLDAASAASAKGGQEPREARALLPHGHQRHQPRVTAAPMPRAGA